MIVICEKCYKAFHKRKSYAEKVKHHFCCRECYFEYWRGTKHHWFGKHHSEETKQKMRLNGNSGKKLSDETKQKIKINHADFKRENHPRWNGSYDPYGRDNETYRNWRTSVYERDSYTCQICGDNKGHNLNAHHIKSFTVYPELRFELTNGITLCKKCHIQIHKNKDEELCHSLALQC